MHFTSQVHHPSSAEGWRWILPVHREEQDGGSAAEEISSPSGMYVWVESLCDSLASFWVKKPMYDNVCQPEQVLHIRFPRFLNYCCTTSFILELSSGSSSEQCNTESLSCPKPWKWDCLEISAAWENCYTSPWIPYGFKQGHAAQTIHQKNSNNKKSTGKQQHLKGNGMVRLAPGRFHILILVIKNQLFHNKTLKFCSQHLSEVTPLPVLAPL